MKRKIYTPELAPKKASREDYKRGQAAAKTRLEELFYAIYQFKGEYYCVEHAAKKLSNGSYTELERMINAGHLATIHEDTVQYEQYPGEIIPLKGVYCAYRTCKAELYPPYE